MDDLCKFKLFSELWPNQSQHESHPDQTWHLAVHPLHWPTVTCQELEKDSFPFAHQWHFLSMLVDSEQEVSVENLLNKFSWRYWLLIWFSRWLVQIQVLYSTIRHKVVQTTYIESINLPITKKEKILRDFHFASSTPSSPNKNTITYLDHKFKGIFILHPGKSHAHCYN